MIFRPWLLLLFAAPLVCGALTARAQKPASAAPPKEKAPAKPTAAAPSAPADMDDGEGSAVPPVLPGGKGTAASKADGFLMRGRLDLMLPVGRSHRGVRFPEFRPVVPAPDAEPADPQAAAVGVTAPLNSLFESDLVTRLDDNHVQFDRAKWVQFDKDSDTPVPSMELTVERGVYDLRSEVLMSNREVIIETPQFRIDADTMLHDRSTGLTRLTGRVGHPVRMTFYVTPEEKTPSNPSPGTPVPTTTAEKPANPEK